MSKTTHDSESWLNQEGEWPPWGKMLERDRGHFREGLVSQESLHTPKEVGLGVPGFCLHLWISNLFGCHIQSQGHITFPWGDLCSFWQGTGTENEMFCSLSISYDITISSKRPGGFSLNAPEWGSSDCNSASSLSLILTEKQWLGEDGSVWPCVHLLFACFS